MHGSIQPVMVVVVIWFSSHVSIGLSTRCNYFDCVLLPENSKHSLRIVWLLFSKLCQDFFFFPLMRLMAVHVQSRFCWDWNVSVFDTVSLPSTWRLIPLCHLSIPFQKDMLQIHWLKLYNALMVWRENIQRPYVILLPSTQVQAPNENLTDTKQSIK